MPDDIATAEVPVVTGNPPAADTPTPAATELPVDVAQLQAEKAKLENELRSVKGLLKKGFNQDARVARLEDQITAMDDGITALVTELSSDPDAPNKVAAIKARHQEQLATSKQTLQGQAQSLWYSIAQEVAVAHGVSLRREPQKVKNILETDPSWAEVRELVLDSWEQQDLEGLTQALGKAEEIRFTLQEKKLRTTVEEAVAKARREEQAKTKEVLKESGALGMPHGGAVGVAAGTHDGYIQRLKKGDPLPSPAEIDRIVAERMRRQ